MSKKPQRLRAAKLRYQQVGRFNFYGYGRPLQHVSDHYVKQFREGADPMPQRLFFVDIHGKTNRAILSVETSAEQRNNTLNKRAKGVHCKGMLEADLIFWTLMSSQVVPFAAGRPRSLALPVLVDHGRFNIATQSELAKQGFKHGLDWFKQVQAAALKEKSDPKERDRTLDDIREPLRTRNKLTDQPATRTGYMVFMGAGGANVCAVALEPAAIPDHFINHQLLYAMETNSRLEAFYVAGMLNSSVVNKAIKESQPKGQQGQQHVHQRALTFPAFNAKDKNHLAVVDASEKIHAAATHIATSHPELVEAPSSSLAPRRRKMLTRIKNEAGGLLEDLNGAAARVMGVT